MDDGGVISNSRGVEQLILECGISIDRLVDRSMERDNLIYTAHMMCEAVYETRIIMEQSSNAVMS